MIEPNAATDELSSPYFLKNEETCKTWEKFAIDNGGTIEGSYNAWSYKLFIRIDDPHPWRIIVSRATYSGGNLLLSSKFQNLHDQIVIKTKVDSEQEFVIKKASFKDFFSRKKTSRLKVNDSYTVLGPTNSAIFDKISGALSKPFKNKQVFQIELKKKIIAITLNDLNEDFDLSQALIDLDFNQE